MMSMGGATGGGCQESYGPVMIVPVTDAQNCHLCAVSTDVPLRMKINSTTLTRFRNDMSKAVTKVIEGRDFSFRYDPSKMRAFLEMIEEDLALLVLRFRVGREVPPV